MKEYLKLNLQNYSPELFPRPLQGLIRGVVQNDIDHPINAIEILSELQKYKKIHAGYFTCQRPTEGLPEVFKKELGLIEDLISTIESNKSMLIDKLTAVISFYEKTFYERNLYIEAPWFNPDIIPTELRGVLLELFVISTSQLTHAPLKLTAQFTSYLLKVLKLYLTGEQLNITIEDKESLTTLCGLLHNYYDVVSPNNDIVVVSELTKKIFKVLKPVIYRYHEAPDSQNNQSVNRAARLTQEGNVPMLSLKNLYDENYIYDFFWEKRKFYWHLQEH